MSSDIDAGRAASDSPLPAGYTVVRSTAQETAALRRAVLRPSLSIEQMALAGDQSPETAYLAVASPDDSTDDPAVVGCVRLEPVPCPWPDAPEVPAHGAWQLRAMATDPAVRGTGVGRLLVDAAVAHVVERGADLIWCNARVGAEQFYFRLGFRPVTGRFVVPDVAEEHVGMVLRTRR